MDRQKLVQSLRIVYHGFGPHAFFNDSTYIVNGLSTVALESKAFINVLRFAIDAGVGKLYLPLITTNQLPDYEFVNNAVNYLTYNGLSAESSKAAVSIFNDMLGWRIAQPTAPVYTDNGDSEYYDPNQESDHEDNRVQRKSQNQKVHKAQKQQVKSQSRSAHESKPKRQGSLLGGFISALLFFIISVAVGFGGTYLFFHYQDIFSFGSNNTKTTQSVAVDNVIYKVKKDGTPVFSKEDVNSSSVAILDKGDKVTVVAQGDKFSSVTLSNGVSGYIQNDKISIAE